MTIRIINKCTQFCLHCMQESGPKESDIMSVETFKNALEFMNQTTNKIINISGGEPTLHPNILEMLKIALSYNKKVVLLTNGDYLKESTALRHEIFCLILKHKNLYIQVTSVKNIYSNFTHEKEFNKILKPLLIWKKVKSNVVFINTLENGIVPIGRVLDNTDKINMDVLRTISTAPRCFNLYNALQHFNGDLISAISHVKDFSLTALCIPLIKENGDMMFGEYGNTCSVVWNVNNEDKNPILDYENLDGPCGKCYKNKVQKNSVDSYLFMYSKRHSKITDSLYFKNKEKYKEAHIDIFKQNK